LLAARRRCEILCQNHLDGIEMQKPAQPPCCAGSSLAVVTNLLTAGHDGPGAAWHLRL